MSLKNYEFWFVVGSQFLYGPEVLETVANRAAEMVEKMNASGNLPCKLVYKVTAKTNKEITDIVREANYAENCAGIITSNKTFDQQTYDEMTRTMNINTLAPMFVTRAMLPDMLERNSGHVCNIASAGGMLSNPKMSVYAASKWGAIGWSDSVRIELQDMKSKVHITTVAPYYINTGMFDGVKSPVIPILKPEYAAKKIIRAIEKNKSFKGIPFGFHFIRFWQFLLPTRLFDWFFGEVMGIYHAMNAFTGRKKSEKPASKAS